MQSIKKLIPLLLLFAVFHVNAQELHFIPKAGFNLATTTNVDGSMKPGLNIGFGVEYMTTPTFALESGIYYSMQGSKFPNIDLKHDYLNIPVLLKLYANRGLNFFVGPQFGFLASVNKIAYANDDFKGELIDNNMTKPFDIAAVIGAGYVFPLGLLVSANFNIGLLKKAKDEFILEGSEVTHKTNGESCKNMVLQFNFGYRF